MSITFYISDYEELITYNALEHFQGLTVEDFQFDPYVTWLDGVPYMSEPAPDTSINFSNDNAIAILLLLAGHTDAVGEWDVKTLPIIARRIISLINNTTELAPAVREKLHIKPKTIIVDDRIVKDGPELIDMGTDIESIIRRLNSLLTVIIKAQKLGKNVCWC